MTSYRTRKRALRIGALGPCVAAMLIVPAAAGARPDVPAQALVPEAATVPHASQLPSSFTTDGGSSYTFTPATAVSVRGGRLPSSFRTDAGSSYAFSPVSTPVGAPAIPTIRTDDGNQTLAIILAGLALGVALMGAGYSAFRVRPTLRSVGRWV
jgi:hypothetical protein